MAGKVKYWNGKTVLDDDAVEHFDLKVHQHGFISAVSSARF